MAIKWNSKGHGRGPASEHFTSALPHGGIDGWDDSVFVQHRPTRGADHTDLLCLHTTKQDVEFWLRTSVR